ncbi:MAG: hypothetical protein IKG87_01500 [Clostridia bacterium]|nr:hypothetical protein [Clostridia bacterium]MBR4576585.1 hypothetical protein [Clostridia bacterium]
MKKQYEEPKAEKLEFDYEEAVVASGLIADQNLNKGCSMNNKGYAFQNKKQCDKA